MAGLRYLSSVVTLTLDEAKCSGCGMCLTVCPHGVFAMENGRAAIVDRDACMECGACALNCPCQAVTVESGVGCVAAIIKGALTGSGKYSPKGWNWQKTDLAEIGWMLYFGAL